MTPSIFQAYRRRYWLLVSNIIENIFFSAVLLGWSSLLLILKAEGFYAYLCDIKDNANLSTFLKNQTIQILHHHENVSYYDKEVLGCPAQDQRLNLCFTVGSFILSASTFPIGLAMDKFGCRYLRMVGALMFGISCLLLMAGHKDISNIIFPAMCINGIGGIIITFTSLQIPNLFGSYRSTMISLMVGSYATSAIVFPVMKGLYDWGISMQSMFLFMACTSSLIILNCYLNIPVKSLPSPDDFEYNSYVEPLKLDHKVSGKKFYSMVSQVGRRMSSREVIKHHNMYISNFDLCETLSNKSEAGKELTSLPFYRIAMTPIFCYSVVTLCITQLRLLFFIGALQQLLLNLSHGNTESVDFYSSVFGIMQLFGLVTAPAIGLIMDWNLKSTMAKKLHENNCISVSSIESIKSNDSIYKLDIKIKKLANARNAFYITNTTTMVFGVLVLLPCLPLQIVTFICHTIIRGFIHSAVGGLYAIAYHFKYYGSLTGLQSILSAVFALLQNPLFILIEGPLKQNPFYVNIGLLILSIVNYGLPVYLSFYCRKLELIRDSKYQIKIEKLTSVLHTELSSSGKDVIDNNNMLQVEI